MNDFDINPIHLTEMKNHHSENLHDFSTMKIIQVMNQEDKTVADVVEQALPQIAKAIDAITTALESGGRLFYIGAGTSGRLGVLDASECPPTFGVPGTLVNGIIAGGEQAIRHPIENAEDDEQAGAEEVGNLLTKQDVLVGIASSGRTPYVLGAIKKANELGIPTVGISCNEGSVLCSLSEYPIDLPVGPEVVTGSTRLKAGTAQKMVLNMITTATMIKLGKVYNNLMVNVQATNEKLRKRSISIIQDITGTDEATAKEMNGKANGDTRVAILMIMYGVDVQEAKNIIRENHDHFPKAIKALEKRK
ncbi:N-acetylmuramic acid 6-phosphate etherase [Sutcliffiella horikoshii]|uniref:N-acetylmuramic acid 6-phosphate etherase n=1 Tax=Sutcliffiella horikoshii TaxID=79883 RepID=UPI002041839B|nr:N-acetylmuramic acid 6-phosphate etherase [Sutcliffiella horikoshii]MCM3618110.1 N-acetylmuramic acid 6-phosphate etherase [Sutcliffiella horikoshii]